MLFKKIKWKNLFSYGKGWTEMRLDSQETINIIGNNGAGKSVFVEALFFALTGRPLRKCKKEQIVNILNKKDCLVVLEVQAGKSNYIISRGAKPNVFTIEKDGTPMDEASMMMDTQTYLEFVLGFSKKNLKHTLIMSTTDYIPFLRLTAADKRMFIEDILAIEIFSVMNKLVKAKLSILKDEMRDNDTAIDKLQYKLNMILEYNKQQRESNDDQIEELMGSIEKEQASAKDELTALKKQAGELKQSMIDLKKRSADLTLGIADKQAAHEKLGNERSGYFHEMVALKEGMEGDKEKYRQNHDKGSKVRYKIGLELEGKKTDLEYYTVTTECSACKQPMDPKFQKKQLADIRAEIEILEKRHKKVEAELDKVEAFKAEIDKIEADTIAPLDEKCKLLETEMSNYQLGWYDDENDVKVNDAKIEAGKKQLANFKATRESVISNTKRRITEVEKQIEDLRNESRGNLKDEDGPAEEVSAAQINQKQLAFKKLVHDVTIKILSDKGIKTYIIKRYIPKLNTLVNQYLSILSAPYEISFDEELEEKIALKGYDKLSYNNFSEGERQRCDIALLFSFLDIAKMKNSLTSNLLIMDEVFDRSLDDDGIRGIINIIDSMRQKGFTIINISHKHQLADQFDVTFRAIKERFSRLEKI
jgi:DNA repair exonuclease SbcCD ATPase subunit